MHDGATSAGDPGGKPIPVQLIGVGPTEEFATAQTVNNDRITWAGAVASLEALHARPWPPGQFVLLLDGDVSAGDLAASLGTYPELVSARPIILQITRPEIRLVVTLMQQGIVDVLPKPYTLPRLCAALDEILVSRSR
ncbi:hypothetical protein [Novosphingobium album (ex Liu et al. 2023)]|uniref:Response regulator n=1 Tax=Novosphingobium album (ex Liu et al. 2023) TaxID=3031130 RepID=A0ABT5WKP5_9SPHN|nr:hypothetical protein [Novosphingobium album (ex Liu et al. 2023)]MDE8650618.1 hypothetical protein [Novosphingobium album (ex Liu et al. 2023)]